MLTNPPGGGYILPPLIPGNAYDLGAQIGVGAIGNTVSGANTLYTVPYYVPINSRGYDRIYFNVTTPASAGSHVRLGSFLNIPGSFGAGELLADFGAQVADASGNQELTIDFNPQPGSWIHLGALVEGTSLAIQAWTTAVPSFFGNATFGGSAQIAEIMTRTYSSGLPASFARTSFSTAWRRLGLRSK